MKVRFLLYQPAPDATPVEYFEAHLHDSKDIVRREATDEDREKYSEAYARFQEAAEQGEPPMVDADVHPVEEPAAAELAPAETAPPAPAPKAEPKARAKKGKQ